MKKISIIVPVYNGESFLKRSLNNLLSQTLQDIEIIIINDGSTDQTQEIVDFFQQAYPEKIKSRNVPNGGAGIARNYALDLAEGEYVGFFDSDDFIANDMYEKLYNQAVDTDSDIVVCGYYVATNTSLRSNQKGDMEYYGKSVYEEPDIFVKGVPYLWNKIFRRSMIEANHIRFRDFRIFEDLEFTYRLFFLANKISKVDEPLYYYMKLNVSSLTAKFTERFFDIIPAISSLIDFSKEIHVYDQFKDYLLFTYLNHMYIRMNADVPLSDLPLKFKYIDACFAYLNSEFPKWKDHVYYFEMKERNKDRYISKGYWKRMSIILKLTKKIKKYRRYFKKARKIIFGKKAGAKYYSYLKHCQVNENQILLDSQHGEDLNGNMFYLLKELQKEEYNAYEIYVTVSKKRVEEFANQLQFYKVSHVKLVVMESKEYFKVLATAKYLFNDTSFPVYFIKRKEQIYFNTWHGTPLKTLGKKTQEDFYNIGNLQKNFNTADYLLYPSEYMMNHMLEDYMLKNISDNKVAMIGYPRNSVFFDTARRDSLKKELRLEGITAIAYMPTWRGTLNNKDNDMYISDLQEKLNSISAKLKPNHVLYLNVHPYLKDYIEIDGYTNVRMFPKQLETYDFLNVCDVLITDYSSVFFDFACTRRPIILFAYDKEAYMRERGLYIDFDRLPFPMVETVDDLMHVLDMPMQVDYEHFIDRYARYDSIHVCEDICQQIILGRTKGIKTIDVPSNGNANILCVANDLSSYFLNETFFSMAYHSDTKKYNYYLTFINANLYKHKRELLRLPEHFEYYGQLYRFALTTLSDRILLALLLRFNWIYRLFAKRVDRLFTKEKNRIFNDIDFQTTIVIGERKKLRLLLFSQMAGDKILYFPHGREFNDKVPSKIYEKYNRIFIEDEQVYQRVRRIYPNCAICFTNKVNSLDELMDSV